MKKTLRRRQTVGFLCTGLLGTGLHFLFDLTGGNVTAALFSSVNESVWEHMKLLFWPMLLFAVLQYRRFGRELAGFLWVKLRGIVTGLLLIPALYYTCVGALGRSPDWFSITVFFLADAAAYCWETRRLTAPPAAAVRCGGAVVLLCLLAIAFGFLTFFPPALPLFTDPVSGTRGFFALRRSHPWP